MPDAHDPTSLRQRHPLAPAVARRNAIARDWDLQRGAVLIPAGLPLPIDGTDQFHDFHAHAEHSYLTGLQHDGGVLAFDPHDGWVLFAQQLSVEEQVWTNASEDLATQAGRSGIDRVRGRDELTAWLEARRGEPLAIAGNDDIQHRPAEYGIPNWLALELDVDGELSARIRESIAVARRSKDDHELDYMRAAAAASIAGHEAGLRLARAGQTERELQIEIEAEFFRAGGDRTAYGSIVGGGGNASVLHFAPSDRAFQSGDMILVDAGAEIEGYASDITRTYPVDRHFTSEQRAIYELVHLTQANAIAAAKPGVEYKDLHLAAALDIATGLVDLDILRGDPQTLVDTDTHALFFPHGLGHMLGLATHDAGGCLAGREPSNRFGLGYLRADLPLRPGYVVTIEPGIYFIRALLTDPARRDQYRDAVNWERVDAMLDFGGIRIEDDVLVTETGVSLLSAALRRGVDDMEQLRQEALDA